MGSGRHAAAACRHRLSPLSGAPASAPLGVITCIQPTRRGRRGLGWTGAPRCNTLLAGGWRWLARPHLSVPRAEAAAIRDLENAAGTKAS